MTRRLGRHGGLCFLCDERGAIAAISDAMHRKDPVVFREERLPSSPPAGDGPRLVFETRGPSFARGLGLVGMYADVERRIAALGLPLRVDVSGFEQDTRGPLEEAHQRDLHYMELNPAGAVALELTFKLVEPFRWEVDSPGLAAEPDGFTLAGGMRLWISSEHPVAGGSGRLWVDLPVGTHSILVVISSRRAGLELHTTALLVRPQDAGVAAVAQACVRGRLVPTLPVASDAEVGVAADLLAELGIARVVAVSDLAAGLRAFGFEDAVVTAPDPVGIDWQRRLADALEAEGPPAAEVFTSGSDPAAALFSHLAATPGQAAGAVVCDSGRPCVRVIAAAYAALAGLGLELIDPGPEQPIAPPDWSASDPEPLAIRIERYRVALAEQVARIAARFAGSPAPPVVVAFTRGYAYSLLRGSDAPWFSCAEVGMLPEDQAPALLLRALSHGSAPRPRFGVTLVVDALSRAGLATEYDLVQESATATVARPVGLAGADADATTVRDIAGALPVDLVALMCHGERDHVRLHDGPLTAAAIAAWHLASAPIVINNSCSSRDTTGAAFLTAGARSYIGTLWPVTTSAAARVSASLVRALTAAAEVPIGAALRDALAAADVDYDDRSAYVLVGLPTVPGRLAPILDRRQETELAEHGVLEAYAGAGRLIDARAFATAEWIRACVAVPQLEALRAYVADDEFAHLEVHNAPGEHLEAIAASHDAMHYERLVGAGGARVDDAIAAYERAVAAWAAALDGDESILASERRLQVVARLLAGLTTLQTAADRTAEAWRSALRTTAAVRDPSAPPPADPPEVDDEELIDAAHALHEPVEYLNAVGLAATGIGRPETAERVFRAALGVVADPGAHGRLLSNLAKLDHERGRLDAAASGYAEALPPLRTAGDRRSERITEAHVARLHFDEGDFDGAAALASELTAGHDDAPDQAWWEADVVLINALTAKGQLLEAADRAHARLHHAMAAGDGAGAWDTLGVLLELRLRSFRGSKDAAAIIDAADAVVTRFPNAPAPLRERVVPLLAGNSGTLRMVVDDRTAAVLDEVVVDLHGVSATRPERRELAAYANSPRARVAVENACREASWRRSGVVWLSPADGRTRTMILDQPPPSLVPPAYVRYPIATPPHVTLDDAHVDRVDCWARTSDAVSYRFDGTPGLIVLEKVGLVRPGPHGHRYRDTWGSARFVYDVTVELPDGSVPVDVGIRSRGLSLGPRVGLGRHGRALTVVLDPDPRVERLIAADSLGILERGWLARVTIDFTEFPDLHAVLLDVLQEDELLPLEAYADALRRTYALVTDEARP
jgi:tetratricopeptide (TPR) repeat protein